MKSFPSLVYALLLICVLGGNLVGQSVTNSANTGFPENGVFHGSGLESVQVNNGNLHIQFPAWSVKGRGLDASSGFVYDNKGWYLRRTCDNTGFCTDLPWPEQNNTMVLSAHDSLGFSLTEQFTNLICQNHGVTRKSNIVLREPNGTKHHFYPDPLDSSWQCGQDYGISLLYSDDGSGWTYNISTGVLTNKHGTTVNLNGGITVEDSNGNQLQSNGTDTLGRSISATSYYDSGGTQQSYVTASTTVTLQTNMCQYSSADYCSEYQNRTWTVPSQITLPNQTSYTFTYAQNAGGEITSMTMPSGAQVSWNYGGWDMAGRLINTRVVTVAGMSSTWTYNYLNNNGNAYTQLQLTDPAGNDLFYNFECFGNLGTLCYVQTAKSYQGSYTSGTLLKTVATDYTSFNVDPTNIVAYTYVPIRDTITLESNQSSHKDRDRLGQYTRSLQRPLHPAESS